MMVTRNAAPAFPSWNSIGFGSAQGGWGGPGGWGNQGGWGGSFHHDFAGASSSAEDLAPVMGPTLISSSMTLPKGPLGSPSAFLTLSPGPADGQMMDMSMAKGEPFAFSFGDAFPRKGPDDFPLSSIAMRGRDFPRASFLSGSALGLQLAQDQALRDVESGPASPTPASSPMTTTDFAARTMSPALQPNPDFGHSNPLGLNLVVGDPAGGRVIDLDYVVLPGRATAAKPPHVASEAAPGESGDPGRAVLADGEPEELLPPHAAGLIASVLPYDQRSLEKAVDQFLDQLQELNVGSLIEPDPVRAIVVSTAVIGAAVAVETARRRLSPRRRRNQPTRVWDANESEELLGFPELPGSWSARWI